MCWVRNLKFREVEQVHHRLVLRTYCKFERNSLYDIFWVITSLAVDIYFSEIRNLVSC